MMIHRIELCISMVRMAIEFVMAVAETVVIVQERNTDPFLPFSRGNSPPPFYGYPR
ncbi:unnamed protein product [Lathyrus sativus]|nr:unnamed protein product [Lathyrus sativus]